MKKTSCVFANQIRGHSRVMLEFYIFVQNSFKTNFYKMNEIALWIKWINNSFYIGAVYLSVSLISRCRVNIINLKSTMPWIESLQTYNKKNFFKFLECIKYMLFCTTYNKRTFSNF